jgi:hypothetical protein
MKETLQTMLSRIDEAPNVQFEEKGGDKQKEIFFNAYWAEHLNKEKLEIKDIVDKKQVFLYGRSFKKWDIQDGRITITIEDPHDIIVDRYCDPVDIDTAYYVSHIHIYKSLRELEANPNYDKTALAILRQNYKEKESGIIKSSENEESLRDKNQRMQDMGLDDTENPEMGEIIVEVNEHYLKIWNDEEEKFEIYVCWTVDDVMLLSKKMMDIMNVDFFPITTWASDIERTDFWSDGPADVVRTPNKILNAWFSQMVENRTMRNFGMNYYDGTKEGFIPQTFNPTPWGWYPVPGRPQDTVQRVDVPALSESLNEMQFLIGRVESATAATAIEKGNNNEKKTLGEIQLMSANANARITSMAKFYRLAWKEYGEKWQQLVLANPEKLDSVILYKKSHKGNLFKKELSPKDWKSEEGYICAVNTAAEKEAEDIKEVQRLDAVSQKYPTNVPLQKFIMQKMLSLADVDPEQQKEITAYADKEQAILDAQKNLAQLQAVKDMQNREAQKTQQAQIGAGLDATVANQQSQLQ